VSRQHEAEDRCSDHRACSAGSCWAVLANQFSFHQQIIYLYPLHAFSSPKEQAHWNQANALALKAIQQLVHDYRTVNQVAAGIAYFQQLQKQYAHTPLAQAARDAEQRLRSGK
jgi:hypothetical protein